MSSSKAPNVAGVDSPGRRTVYSMCGMCAVRCPIQVEVEDGRVIWLQGNPNDGGMGTSLCAKGGAGLAFQADDERPQTPLIRVGERGAGQWRRASWDEALDYIEKALKEVIEECGPRGIALSDRGGPFADLSQSFVKALGSPNYFNHDVSCGRNANHATKTLMGLGRTDAVYDFKNSKHIVLIGRNIIEALQVKEAKAFITAMGNGAHCTYIDPRATLTASKATRFLQIRPNTEYALLLAVINELISKNLYDTDFVAKWCTGFEELKELVAGKTPQWQEQYTGIGADEVIAFVAELAADAPRVIVHAGWMTARHSQSFYVSRASHIINVLLGAIEVKGGILINKSPGDYGKKGLRKLSGNIPAVEEPRVDGVGTTYKHFDKGPGLMHLLFPAIESGQPYKMGAYFAFRHDPLTGLSDPEAQKRALDKLKLIVSIDVNYSETGWFSDVILPESTYLERANPLAGKGGSMPSIQMRDQAIAPRFDSRPAWWIFRELARRMGKGQYFDFETIEELWRFQLEGTGLSIEEIRQVGFLPLADKQILFDRDKLPFGTKSGKVEFISPTLTEAGLPSLAEYKDPEPLATGEFRLLFGRAAQHNHGHTMNNPLLHELAPSNDLWMHPSKAGEQGLKDGDMVKVSNNGYSGVLPLKVTSWIHPDAVFMLHGYGRTIPRQTRAFNKGVADQRLQVGILDNWDKAGGGLCMTETVVKVEKVK